MVGGGGERGNGSDAEVMAGAPPADGHVFGGGASVGRRAEGRIHQSLPRFDVALRTSAEEDSGWESE